MNQTHTVRDNDTCQLAPDGWIRTQHTRRHELARMEKGNFNVSFPLWDWLLGTRLSEREGEPCIENEPA